MTDTASCANNYCSSWKWTKEITAKQGHFLTFHWYSKQNSILFIKKNWRTFWTSGALYPRFRTQGRWMPSLARDGFPGLTSVQSKFYCSCTFSYYTNNKFDKSLAVRIIFSEHIRLTPIPCWYYNHRKHNVSFTLNWEPNKKISLITLVKDSTWSTTFDILTTYMLWKSGVGRVPKLELGRQIICCIHLSPATKWQVGFKAKSLLYIMNQTYFWVILEALLNFYSVEPV